MARLEGLAQTLARALSSQRVRNDEVIQRRMNVLRWKGGGSVMANRAAAVSQDLDLWKGVLFACPFGSVSHDHHLDGDQGEKRITDEQ